MIFITHIGEHHNDLHITVIRNFIVSIALINFLLIEFLFCYLNK